MEAMRCLKRRLSDVGSGADQVVEAGAWLPGLDVRIRYRLVSRWWPAHRCSTWTAPNPTSSARETRRDDVKAIHLPPARQQVARLGAGGRRDRLFSDRHAGGIGELRNLLGRAGRGDVILVGPSPLGQVRIRRRQQAAGNDRKPRLNLVGQIHPHPDHGEALDVRFVLGPSQPDRSRCCNRSRCTPLGADGVGSVGGVVVSLACVISPRFRSVGESAVLASGQVPRYVSDDPWQGLDPIARYLR